MSNAPSSYLVTATRNGHEDVGSYEILGEAWTTTYATREEAQQVADGLTSSWQLDWDLGACPVYAVEVAPVSHPFDAPLVLRGN